LENRKRQTILQEIWKIFQLYKGKGHFVDNVVENRKRQTILKEIQKIFHLYKGKGHSVDNVEF